MEIFLDILRFIGVLLLVLMIFNIMIIVHEWGHFLAGRWRGLEIDRFQIWFGKPIWKKTHNGVQYGLGTIPAGGFVSLPQMVTMESIEGEVDEEKKRNLPPISPLDKIIVAFAGPLFSFLLAVLFAVIVWAVGKPVGQADNTTVVGIIGKDSPAEKAGILPGDEIKAIDGKPVHRFLGMNDSVLWHFISSERDVIEVEVERPGEGKKTFQLDAKRPEREKTEGPWYKQFWSYLTERPPLRRPEMSPYVAAVVGKLMENSPAEEGGLQPRDVVVAVNGEPVKHFQDVAKFGWEAGDPVTLSVKRGVETAGSLDAVEPFDVTVTAEFPDEPKDYDRPLLGVIWDLEGIRAVEHPGPIEQVSGGFRTIVNTLRAVFSPKSDISAGHLSGPVGIMGVYYDLFQHKDGWRKVLWFSVILNINLAILNLLPFPVLDGGHIVMATLEWIRRKPMPVKVLEVVQTAFVLMLLGFMAFVTFKDVGDRVPKGGAAEAEKVPPKFYPN